MDICTLRALVLLLAMRPNIADISSNKGIEIARLADVSCNECTLAEHFARSKLHCFVACSGDENCQSFTYVHDAKACKLQNCVPTCTFVNNNLPGARQYMMIDRITVPPGYVYEHTIRGWYKVMFSKKSWQYAQNTCGLSGGHLLVIRSSAAQEWINSLLLSDPMYIYSDPASPYWIDGNDKAVEGAWTLDDSCPVMWASWGPGQPASDTRRNCAVMRSDWNYNWDDVICGNTLRFICHID